MKQFILFLLYLLIPMRVFSNNQDSIKVVQLQNDIMQIQMRIDSLEKMNQRNILYIDSLNMNINILQDSLLATNIGIKIFQKHLVEFIEDMRRTSQENILHMKSLETYMSVLQDSVMTVNMKMLKGDKYLKQYIEDEKQTTDKELDILFLGRLTQLVDYTLS